MSDGKTYTEQKDFYLRRFRRCRNVDTLERVYESMRDRSQVSEIDRSAFESAADHRRAEIASGKLWDKIPPHVWQYVK